jgi:hypothetical protein
MMMKIIQEKVSSVNQTTSLLIASTFSSFATSIRAESDFYFMTKNSSNDKIGVIDYEFKDTLIL